MSLKKVKITERSRWQRPGDGRERLLGRQGQMCPGPGVSAAAVGIVQGLHTLHTWFLRFDEQDKLQKPFLNAGECWLKRNKCNKRYS